VQLVGLKLKKHFKSKINLIIDYRDSWNTTKIFRKDFKICQLISEKLEKRALKKTDHFTYISKPMLDKVEKIYKLNMSEKAKLIMNGYNKLQSFSNLKNRSEDIIKIGYFGIVSDHNTSYRNITNLLEVVNNNPNIFKGLEFHLFGKIRIGKTDLIKRNNFHIHNSLSHEEALKRMSEMDFLLLIHSDPESSDEVITGKFFEYVAVKRPILCLSPENMEARRLIDTYNIGITADINNKQDMIDKLKSLRDYKGYDFYSGIDVSIFQRERQYEKFLEILK
jgi:glycosyltransferase involved in cell wall biosynthesis